jgi:hypothetical protein
LVPWVVFTPVRTESKPPGTDRVLNWAPYGLYQEQSYHLLSAKEVADKKKLAVQRYEASEGRKENRRRRQYEASEGRKENKRRYEASEGRKENKRRYEAIDLGKENRRQAGVVEAAGNKRARELLEAHENNKRHAVQQKTNEPSCGVLGDLLGGS